MKLDKHTYAWLINWIAVNGEEAERSKDPTCYATVYMLADLTGNSLEEIASDVLYARMGGVPCPETP